MANEVLGVNIDAVAVINQNQEENERLTPKPKTQFDVKNYLNARLAPNETTKSLTIRLLPFSPEGGSPFQKVYMHTIKVNKEVSASGWKTFVCPTHNKKGDRCPFCETSTKARELRNTSFDEATKKKFGDIEFMNRVKEMWVVRCIERGHEDDGVKFWLFPASKKHDGVYDKMTNLFQQRWQAAQAKGKVDNIFDLTNGKDLIVTLNKGTDGKTAIQIVDDGDRSPLSEDFEKAKAWVEDPKKWDEVYTVKSYDYMSIVLGGGVPIFDKVIKKYIDKKDLQEKQEIEKEQELKENLMEPKKDFSAVVNDISQSAPAQDTPQVANNDIDDLPF